MSIRAANAGEGPAFRSRRPARSRPPRVLECTCYRGLRLFHSPRVRNLCAEQIEAARARFDIQIDSWVVLPGGARLLAMARSANPRAIGAFRNALRRQIAELLLARWRARGARVLQRMLDQRGRVRFWQPRAEWDRRITSEVEIRERRNEIHWAPVAGRLAATPQDWAWSSARWYHGDRAGAIHVDPL